jgi:hypothetical protein
MLGQVQAEIAIVGRNIVLGDCGGGKGGNRGGEKQLFHGDSPGCLGEAATIALCCSGFKRALYYVFYNSFS